MDLEEAANTARAKVKELEGHVEEGEEAAEELHQSAAREGGRLDDDFEALAEGTSRFFERATEARTQLSEEVQRTLQSMQELHESIGDARQQAVQALAQAQADAEALAEQVTTAQPGITSLQEQIAPLQGAVEAIKAAASTVGID